MGLVDAICRRLDGLPLAIELAAARTRWLSLADLIRQLDDDLERGDHGADDPLQLALETSRALLSTDQRHAFDALSVFTGSFTIDAALSVIASVCPDADALATFGAIVEHSLIDVIPGDPRRYRLLETVHRYARTCLSDTSSVEEIAESAHFDHFLRFVERRWPVGAIHTVHPWSMLMAEKLEIEAAIGRRVHSDRAAARRMLGALGWYWRFGGDAERLESAARACDQGADGDPPAQVASFNFSRMLGAVLLGNDPTEFARRAHSAALDSERWAVAAWSRTFSVAPDTMWIDLELVAQAWDEIVRLFRRVDDVAGEGWASLLVLGFAQVCRGRHDDAEATFRRAAALFERCGDAIGRARARIEVVELSIWTGQNLDRAREAFASIPEISLPLETDLRYRLFGGMLAAADGDHETSVRLHRSALDRGERHIPSALLTNTLRCFLGMALRDAGQLAEAVGVFRLAVVRLERHRSQPGGGKHAAWVLEMTIAPLIDLGRLEAAGRVAGSAQRIRDESDPTRPRWDESRHRMMIDELIRQLGRERFEAARTAGGELELAATIELVRSNLETH